MAKLEVRHLTISFRTNNGAVQAVRDLSFELNAGETLAVAGESGSGKSVTARAVMGILPGNAMVEGGEIIYDGRDLLKIPEEEYHTLRGHRLAMVFQDPLSALNPIMRIGRQLTEAMILNHRERRADGKRRYEAMLKQLEQDGDPDMKAQIQRFRAIVDAGVKLENGYEEAREAAVGALDGIEEADVALLKRDARSIPEITRRLTRLGEAAVNPWLTPGGEAALQAALDAVKARGTRFRFGDEADYRQALETLRTLLDAALAAERPDFFSIGGLIERGEKPDPRRESVQAMNARARAALDGDFLNGFLDGVSGALRRSRARARRARGEAAELLRRVRLVFLKDHLEKKACARAAEMAAAAVKQCVDPLALDKDSALYVFESSLNAGIERYFEGLERNPVEQKRFARAVARHRALEGKGKAAVPPPPLHLVDVEKARDELAATVSDMIARLEADPPIPPDDRAEAMRIVEYLVERARESTYRLSASMARHRAIELMKEVGIPDPRRRFDQYPFEFSGGMRQRIVIAIALSANPDILICDEPTTALDVTIQAQILELINRLKEQRRLSVLFITHDLGVVANMADRIAVVYAGKIVEYGTAEDVFYDPRHPYTWALLASMPDLETTEKLEAIPGTPPDMIAPPRGDAFAARNRYAMEIDFEAPPPMFQISPTHSAATWLMHPDAPKVEPPAIVTERIERMRAHAAAQKGGEEA